MPFQEFDGELDKEAPALEPFDGELDSRRGGTRAEAKPFVALTPDENARREFAQTDPRRVDVEKSAGDLLNQPDALNVSGRQQAEREQMSMSPAAQERSQQQALYDTRASRQPQEAKPLELTNRITTGIRESTSNPAARGVIAGAAQLGKVGTGAVRLAADLMGADEVARFAKGAEGRADATSQGATQDLKGNDKLAADVFSSITNSLPSVAVGMIGGPAMTTLFAQSTLSEYGAGRDAGFSKEESLSRAGIMGFAEALGERFGFGEQLRLFKGVAKKLPTGELAKTLGEMLVKEVPGEQLTTAMQFMADKIGPAALSPNATIDQYLEAAGETLKVTLGQSLVMGGGPAAIGAVRNEARQIDASRDRNAMSMAERAASDAGFKSPVISFLTPKPKAGQPTLKPTEAKAASISRFDELAAGFGLPARALDRAKEAVDQMMSAGRPAGDVPEFLGKLAEAYNKRGMFAKPLEPQAVAELQAAIDGPADEALNVTGLADEAAPGAPQTDTPASAPENPQGAANGQEDQTQEVLTGAPADVVPAGANPIEGEKINRKWSAFSPESGTLNIPRSQMPQIASEHRGALVNFLNARGVSHEMATVDPAELKPTQAEFEPKKVAAIAENPSGRSLLVSADGHILDGHHQWKASLDAGQSVRVVRLDADIQDLLRLAHQFPSSTVAKGPTRKAADDQSVVPDPAVGVPGAGATGTDPARASGGVVRPVAADADGAATFDPGTTDAGSGSGVPAGRDGEPDAALSGEKAKRVIGSYGKTPNAATAIELRPNKDGTVTPYDGKNPMVDFDSGDPITLPADITDAKAADAIRKAGAVSERSKFFGVKADEAAPGKAEPTDDEKRATGRQRIDGLKKLLACLQS